MKGSTAKISKVGKAVPPFDSHKTQPSLKIKIQLQNNDCTFQLDLMCTRSSLLLLLKGMAQFLPSPERPYCYSQRKFSDVFIGRHQHQAIKNICNIEDGASTCSDRFGPSWPFVPRPYPPTLSPEPLSHAVGIMHALRGVILPSAVDQ